MGRRVGESMTIPEFLTAIRGLPTEREQIEGALRGNEIDPLLSAADIAALKKRINAIERERK